MEEKRMKKKIICILVVTLLITTSNFAIATNINVEKDKTNDNLSLDYFTIPDGELLISQEDVSSAKTLTYDDTCIAQRFVAIDKMTEITRMQLCFSADDTSNNGFGWVGVSSVRAKDHAQWLSWELFYLDDVNGWEEFGEVDCVLTPGNTYYLMCKLAYPFENRMAGLLGTSNSNAYPNGNLHYYNGKSWFDTDTDLGFRIYGYKDDNSLYVGKICIVSDGDENDFYLEATAKDIKTISVGRDGKNIEFKAGCLFSVTGALDTAIGSLTINDAISDSHTTDDFWSGSLRCSRFCRPGNIVVWVVAGILTDLGWNEKERHIVSSSGSICSSKADESTFSYFLNGLLGLRGILDLFNTIWLQKIENSNILAGGLVYFVE